MKLFGRLNKRVSKFIISALLACSGVWFGISSITDMSIFNRLNEEELSNLNNIYSIVYDVVPDNAKDSVKIADSSVIKKLDKDIATVSYEAYFSMCSILPFMDYASNIVEEDGDGIFVYPEENKLIVKSVQESLEKLDEIDNDLLSMYKIVSKDLIELDKRLVLLDSNEDNSKVSVIVKESVAEIAEKVEPIQENLNNSMTALRKNKYYTMIASFGVAIGVSASDLINNIRKRKPNEKTKGESL